MEENSATVNALMTRMRDRNAFASAHEDLITSGLHLFASLAQLDIDFQSEVMSTRLLAVLGLPLVALMRFTSTQIQEWLRLETIAGEDFETRELLDETSASAALTNMVLQEGFRCLDNPCQFDFQDKLLMAIDFVDGAVNIFSAFMDFREHDLGEVSADDHELRQPLDDEYPNWGILANDYIVYQIWMRSDFMNSDIFYAHCSLTDEEIEHADLTEHDWFAFVNDSISGFIPVMRMILAKVLKNGVRLATGCFQKAASIAQSGLPKVPRFNLGLRYPHVYLLTIMSRIHERYEKVAETAELNYHEPWWTSDAGTMTSKGEATG